MTSAIAEIVDDGWAIEKSRMEQADIIRGATYVYSADLPPKFKGHLYRVALRDVFDVPTYVMKVLVKGLTGPDKDKWYTCSIAYFVQRFQPATAEQLVNVPSTNGSTEATCSCRFYRLRDDVPQGIIDELRLLGIL